MWSGMCSAVACASIRGRRRGHPGRFLPVGWLSHLPSAERPGIPAGGAAFLPTLVCKNVIYHDPILYFIRRLYILIWQSACSTCRSHSGGVEFRASLCTPATGEIPIKRRCSFDAGSCAAVVGG